MVDCSVLVLNSLYQAVQITGPVRAFRLFYAGRARALSADFTPYDFGNWCDLPVGIGDDVIRTPTRRIRIPRVIQLVCSTFWIRVRVRFRRRRRARSARWHDTTRA